MANKLNCWEVMRCGREPGGTEAVVMKEFVTLRGDRAEIAWLVDAGDHIRRVGEEFQRGDEILPVGTRVTPPVVGMLAFLGRKSVAVGRRPRAMVITMGDELVAPGAKIGPGQINDAVLELDLLFWIRNTLGGDQYLHDGVSFLSMPTPMVTGSWLFTAPKRSDLRKLINTARQR